jgi:hypothetical protein
MVTIQRDYEVVYAQLFTKFTMTLMSFNSFNYYIKLYLAYI